MPVKDKFLELVLAEKDRLERKLQQEASLPAGYYPQAEFIQTRKDGHPSCMELADGGNVAYVRLQDVEDLEQDVSAILSSLRSVILYGQSLYSVKLLQDLLLLVAWVAQDGFLQQVEVCEECGQVIRD